MPGAMNPGPAAISKPCPHCHAEATHPCVTPRGRVTEPHAIRYRSTPSRGGQRSRLTDELHKALCEALSAGIPLGVACAAAGIGTTTLHRWLALADTDHHDAARYRALRDSLVKARGQGAEKIHRLVLSAAKGGALKRKTPIVHDGKIIGYDIEKHGPDWRAGAFILERSYGLEYGRRHTVEVTSGDGATLDQKTTDRANLGALLDVEGLSRIAAGIGVYREQKELEWAQMQAAKDAENGAVVEGEVVDADVVEPAPEG